MDGEIKRIEAEIRALLPMGWELMSAGPIDDLPEPDWGDLDQETMYEPDTLEALRRAGKPFRILDTETVALALTLEQPAAVP